MDNIIGKFMKLTQFQLAKKLFVSEKTISKWENGKSVPDTLSLQKLSDIFNVTISEILTGKRNVINFSEDEIKEIEQKSYGNKCLKNLVTLLYKNNIRVNTSIGNKKDGLKIKLSFLINDLSDDFLLCIIDNLLTTKTISKLGIKININQVENKDNKFYVSYYTLNITLIDEFNLGNLYSIFKSIFSNTSQTKFTQYDVVKFNECAIKLKYLDYNILKKLYIEKDINIIGIEYDFEINSFRYYIGCVDKNNTLKLNIDTIQQIYKDYLNIVL